MNIQTVLDNLDQSIAGKELMLAGLKDGGDAGLYTLRYMLNLNIDELKRIRADVALCIPPAAQARDMMQGLWKV